MTSPASWILARLQPLKTACKSTHGAQTHSSLRAVSIAKAGNLPDENEDVIRPRPASAFITARRSFAAPSPTGLHNPPSRVCGLACS